MTATISRDVSSLRTFASHDTLARLALADLYEEAGDVARAARERLEVRLAGVVPAGTTHKQVALLADLAEATAAGPVCTAEFRRYRGDRQAYETHLRNRLFVLEAKGLAEQDFGAGGRRLWSLSPAVLAAK